MPLESKDNENKSVPLEYGTPPGGISTKRIIAATCSVFAAVLSVLFLVVGIVYFNDAYWPGGLQLSPDGARGVVAVFLSVFCFWIAVRWARFGFRKSG